ncbi:hypothetical protein B5807_01823 [Epicoccum nigrum]|jgi:hypothetical protein|uniref:Deoxyribonuclease NucA/NucB domain-containing protein n=1 Tax=Epicoccum nigrum TaxID=105696 RepID=A0A1Y2MEB6_EPING|nr:hypothetical protein B5807_01823 [Epicoccum nigrum]
MHPRVWLIAILILLAGSVLSIAIPGDVTKRQATNGPHPGTIIWICTNNADPVKNIPNICTNMCYGAFCRGYGTSLHYDKYEGRSKDERAKAAGCGRKNHCSIAPLIGPPSSGDYQCDEYPFGSTSDADRKDISAVNR